MRNLCRICNPLEAAKMYEILYVTEPEESNTESKESSEAASTEKTAAENGSQENSQNRSEAQSSVKETRVVKAAQSKLQCPGHVIRELQMKN